QDKASVMRRSLPAVGRVLGYCRAERRTILQGWIACTISSVGDLTAGLTLGAITHTMQFFPGLSVLVPAAISIRDNVFGAIGSLTNLPLVRRAVRESIPILALAGAIDVVAGLVIDKRLDKFVTFPALLVLVPPFLEDVGALGGILSSRLASKLHLGAIEARKF